MELSFHYDYKTMPKSKATTEGMRVIEGDMENLRAEIESEDLVYQRKNGKNLKIRLIYPDYFEKEKAYPLVFHIQGSAWFKQNLDSHILDLKEIVTSGYILAIVEYLPLPEGKFPGQVEDAKCAMRYLQRHADELKIDLTNIFLSGDSSGAHTALLCWATWNSGELDTSSKELPNIKGCIDLYGVVDFATISDAESGLDHSGPSSPGGLLLGGIKLQENSEAVRKAAVPYYLRKDSEVSPLLIIHGNKDKVVPFEQSVQLYEHCKKMNIDAEIYCVNNADHGGSAFYCPVVLKAIVNFLKTHTRPHKND